MRKNYCRRDIRILGHRTDVSRALKLQPLLYMMTKWHTIQDYLVLDETRLSSFGKACNTIKLYYLIIKHIHRYICASTRKTMLQILERLNLDPKDLCVFSSPLLFLHLHE